MAESHESDLELPNPPENETEDFDSKDKTSEDLRDEDFDINQLDDPFDAFETDQGEDLDSTKAVRKKKKTFKNLADQDEINEMAATRGLSKETIQKRENHWESLVLFLKTFGYPTIEKLLDQDTPIAELQGALNSFFGSYTVGKAEELPTRNYSDQIRSHLRISIKEKTDGRLDICDKIKMPLHDVSLN